MTRLVPAAVLATAVLGACAHPLPQADVDALTTCHDADLKKIRQSLLLNGFEVQSQSPTDLVTDWKQVDGYGTNRMFQRITVVQLDPSTYRFKVRLKQTYVELDGNRFRTRDHDHHRTTIIDMRQPVEITDDVDPTYDDAHRDAYEETRRQVCGTPVDSK